MTAEELTLIQIIIVSSLLLSNQLCDDVFSFIIYRCFVCLWFSVPSSHVRRWSHLRQYSLHLVFICRCLATSYRSHCPQFASKTLYLVIFMPYLWQFFGDVNKSVTGVNINILLSRLLDDPRHNLYLICLLTKNTAREKKFARFFQSWPKFCVLFPLRWKNIAFQIKPCVNELEW